MDYSGITFDFEYLNACMIDSSHKDSLHTFFTKTNQSDLMNCFHLDLSHNKIIQYQYVP